MRNYLYMSKERIDTIYNQLVERTSVEEIRTELDKKGVLTDWKFKLGAGFAGFVKGDARHSRRETQERTLEESIRSRLELEQKVTFIETKINFASIDDLVEVKESLQDRAVSFSGVYYSKGLKAPNYYSSDEWDGILPFLYKKVRDAKIRIVYSPLHFISQTPWAVVRGRLRIDGIGFVANCDDTDIVTTPIAFGSLISDLTTRIFDG